MIIGVDYHPSVQQIAFVDKETGEFGERRLNHSDGEAEKFYRDLKARGISVRVGMEATGYARWFERLLAELGYEVWIGDPAEIKTRRVRKQKTDRQDAELLLKLLLEDRFPRVWTPSPENRDLRQLLWHRHRLVQMRTRIMNQLQAVAMNEGHRWKKRLWTERGRVQLEKFSLAPWGHPAPARPIGVAGPIESDHRGVNLSHRAGGRETARSAAADDASRCGPAHSARLCADYWDSHAFSLQQADQQLCWADSQRGVQRRLSAAGTHQQARQCPAAILACGSSPGSSALRSGVAKSIPTPGAASGTSDRYGSHSAQTSSSLVPDVAQGMGLSAHPRVRFARGTARNRTWCEIDHRPNGWASRSLKREFEVVIMVDLAIGEMFGSD